MNVLTEAGLYAIIFKSRKPEAKEFRRWVTHEVLPAIRKQGFYAPARGGVQGEFSFALVGRMPRELSADFIKAIAALYGKRVAQKLFAPYLGIDLADVE